MKHVRYFARGLWVDKHLSQWMTTIMIMLHFGLAMAIIIGGPGRFLRPSYTPLIDYTQGHVWIWGVVMAISAILMGTPFRYLNIAGLWIGMVWHICWMSCFTIALLRYPDAAATGIPAYGTFAMICAALLTARVIDKTGE